MRWRSLGPVLCPAKRIVDLTEFPQSANRIPNCCRFMIVCRLKKHPQARPYPSMLSLLSQLWLAA